MKRFCHYHPIRPAHWHCPRCRLAFCTPCLTLDRNTADAVPSGDYRCPCCQNAVLWVGAASLIVPFWKRLPKFFAYPFQKSPFLLILVLALLSGVLFAKITFLNLLVRMLFSLIMLKYAYAALTATAGGDLVAPEINRQTLTGEFSQVIKHYVIFFFIFAGFFLILLSFGVIAAVVYLAAAFFFLPAMIILLATTNDLAHAVNPSMFSALTFKIGKGYLLMYFFLILLYLFAPIAVRQLTVKFTPAGLYRFSSAFADYYYLLIMYHLMGYVILQYNQEVGFPVKYENFRDPSLHEFPVEINVADRLLNRIDRLVLDGKLDEAIDTIEERTREAGITHLKVSQRYFNLLERKQRHSDLDAHCPVHLQLLTRDNQKIKSLRLYSRCLARDPKFTVDAETLFKIGGWLEESAKWREALKTFRRLTETYPKDDRTPRALYRMAMILNERLQEPVASRKILVNLIAARADHDITPQARRYLATLPRSKR
jgi:tetratricopeptide (TPR) repeat protein